MKKRYLLLPAVLAVVLLVALPATAVASDATTGPFPVTQAHFLTHYGPGSGSTWEVDASVVGSAYFDGFPGRAPEPVRGVISVSNSRVLPDGSQVETAFTLRPKYHASIDYVEGMPDAGAVAGIAGYVVESSGEGAPAVGDFYAFYFFDGAQGLTQPDGTIRYYGDRWTFTHAADTPIWLRNFPRSVLYFLATYGLTGMWLNEGDISIKNGAILSPDS